MARFVFKLDTVLGHRRRLEQEAQRQYAQKSADVAAVENELRELNTGLVAANDALRRGHLTGSIDVTYLTAHRRYTNDVSRHGTRLLQKLALAQRAAEDSQRALAEAAKERKVLEKLRERHEARWKAEQDRKEAARTDDEAGQFAFAQLAGFEAMNAQIEEKSR